MTQRLDYIKLSPTLFKKLADFSMAVAASSIEPAISHLLDIRTSQLNGCAFCLDMHIKQAKIHGEGELRLHHVAAWRESPLFSARERAALAWTEALTQLSAHGVSDDLYASVREAFSEQELSDLTYQVMAINAWNRANIAFRTVPGTADKAFGLEKAVFG